MTKESRPLKVCHIAATTEAAAWVFEQLRELRDRHGYEVSAILNGDKGGLVDRLRAAGIPVHACDFDFTSTTDLLGLPRKVMTLVRLLQREKFDVIQTHLFHSMVIGRIAAWFADVPVRLSMIAGPFHLEAYTPRWIDRLTCWTDTAIIASCEFTRTLYKSMGVREDRLALVYYGPDETKFDPATTTAANLSEEFGWPPGTPLIGMVAYFYTELPRSRWIPPHLWGRSVKSQEDLIRAAPIVLHEFPDAKFVLVGTGWEAGGHAYLRRMQDLVATSGLQDSVVFTGFRTDVASILRAISVSVQPSLSENLGGTIESLLMECPTVATRVGGMTDSVIDGKTGVLVEPANPASLAEGILRLLRDRAAARRYGTAGRAHMLAGFTLRHTADNLAKLYREKSSAHPAGYRRLIRGIHILTGSALCALIALRYFFVDAWILRLWDRGWHHPRRLSLGPPSRWLNRLYAFVGRNAPGLGVGQKCMSIFRRYGFLGRHDGRRR